MKIEIVQLAGRDGDMACNLNRTVEAIAACAADTDIVVFPEAQLTGFLDVGQLASLAHRRTGRECGPRRRARAQRRGSGGLHRE